MDLNALHALIAVAETASFSLAAQRLFLTQPAISKRIAALEEELGTALFDRIGRRVTLTEAGRALLPRARRILEDLEDSRRAIANLSGRIEGPLRIGTSHHIGLHRLPPYLRAYTAAHPKVELDIEFMDSEAACQAVEHGELELAVVTLPPTAPPALDLRPLWVDELRVVVAPDHQLASQRRYQPADLARFPAILPAVGTYTREVVESAFGAFQLKPQVKLATNYLETIKMLVSVGLGWSVLPESMVDDEVRPLNVTGFAPTRHLGLVQHRGRTLSNAARALCDLLEELPSRAGPKMT